MTKAQVVEIIATRTGISRVEVITVVEALMTTIRHTVLRHGQDVTLRGLGSFRVVTRKAKKARDINRGVELYLPERKVVKFVPSRYFKNPNQG